MPERRLSYTVDVDTGSAVRDLQRLGTAGADAGKDIADGFGRAESASAQALAALSAQLDKVQSDAKGMAEAVAAIKANLTVNVDDSKVAGFVADLKGKMGLAFDDVTADARQFAAVLERGVNLDKTTSQIRGLGTELEHSRGEADQSRSVLANLAGNSAQTLSGLGGVVGDLGVGIGQLAEYAVDGNIALSGLAGVAGPMAALAAASYLVSAGVKAIGAETKEAKDQTADYRDVLAEAGDAATNIRDSIQKAGQLSFADNNADSFLRDLAELLPLVGEGTVDLAAIFQSAGLKVGDYSRAVTGVGDSWNETITQLSLARTAGQITADQFHDAVAEMQDQRDRIGAAGSATSDFFSSTAKDVTEMATAARVAADPLAVLADRTIQLGQVTVDSSLAWRLLVDDMRDGTADTESSALAVDAFAQAMGIGRDQVVALAIAQGDAAKSTADLVTHTDAAATAADDQADAVRGQVDALQALIDKQNDMLSATDDLADAQQAWDDGLAAFPQTVADSTKAMDDATAGSPEWVQARNDQRDALEQLVDQYVRATELQAQANGQQLTAVQRVQAQAHALGQLAGTLDADTIPAVADYYSQIFKIPESRKTDFEMVLATGDQAAIEQFVADNSGTQTLAISVEADKAKLAKVNDDVGAVTGPRTVPVTAEAHTATARSQLSGLQSPLNVPVNANTAPADSDMSWWRRIQSSTPVSVPVHGAFGSFWTGLPSAPQSRSAPASATTATPASAMLEADELGDVDQFAELGAGTFPVPTTTAPALQLAVPAASVVVNLSAGVIGDRWDLQRWIRAATRNQARFGQTLGVAPS